MDGQFIEPNELAMLRRAMVQTLVELERAEFALHLALREMRLARDRQCELQAWVQAVDIHIKSETHA